MNFQKKLLSLAVIGLALSAPVAHAAIDAGSVSPGNGELFFSLWSDNGTAGNTADDVSYTRDLGLRFNDFASAVNPITLTAQATTAGFSQSFAPDVLISSFLNTATLAGANLLWNVVAGDSFGADRLLSTAAQGTSALPSQATTAFRNVSGGVNLYTAAVNNLAGNTNTALNNSITATFSDGNAYAGGTAWGSNIGGRVTFNNSGTIGAQLPFFLQYETSTTQTGNALQQQFTSATGTGADGSAAYWTLDASGNLSYNVAAVPEADTWAMFAAGLLAVGAIARRRLAA